MLSRKKTGITNVVTENQNPTVMIRELQLYKMSLIYGPVVIASWMTFFSYLAFKKNILHENDI